MFIHRESDFIKQIQSFNIGTEYIIVKPNWISNTPGEYTEPEILDWLLKAFPEQKKIVIESYTPWRGQQYVQNPMKRQEEDDQLAVTLKDGINYWDFYREEDGTFLKETGIGRVLSRHEAEYINITNEVWSNNCVDPKIIKALIGKATDFYWTELLSYVPKTLFDLREKATLISLAKLKEEPSIPEVRINMSVKNIFGLIPHPSRWVPFHDENHKFIPQAIAEMYLIYTTVFGETLWITEGIKTMVKNYCNHDQFVEKEQGLFFAGRNGLEVDQEACRGINVEPSDVVQLKTVKDFVK